MQLSGHKRNFTHRQEENRSPETRSEAPGGFLQEHFSPQPAQNDAAALGSLAGRHQLLRPGALPLPPGDPHPGRLHQLHAHRQRGAASRHPEQAALQRPQPGPELRRGQLQLRTALRQPRVWGRSQERGSSSGTRQEEEEEGEEQDRCRQVPQQEEGEDRVSAEGVGEAGDGERRPEGSDRGAEAAEAAAGLHAEPAPAHLHRPGAERPDARRREEPLHPAHQGERPAPPQHHLLLLHHLLHHPLHLLHGDPGRWVSDAGPHSLPPMSTRGCCLILLYDLRRLRPWAELLAETQNDRTTPRSQSC